MSNDILSKIVTSEIEEYVDIAIYYKVSPKNNAITVLEEEEALALIDKEKDVPEKDKTVCILNTKWKQARWREQNDIMNTSQKVDHMTGQPSFDFILYRDRRIKTLLVEWDITTKDDSGNEHTVPVSEELIDRLPVEIVTSLYAEYEKKSGLTADEEGKL